MLLLAVRPRTACARPTSRIRWWRIFLPNSRSSSMPERSSLPSRSPIRLTARSMPNEQCGPGLPCAHRRSVCRNRHPVTGKPGWWETHGRPRQADRHRALLRHLRQCARRLHGHDRPGLDRSRQPASLGASISRSSPSATWCGRRRCCSITSASTTLFAVVGGSMGGMQVLQWAASYPQRVFAALPIACAPRHSAQNIAFHEVGRQAVMADPDWRGGDYFAEGRARAAASRSRAWPRISPICRSGAAPQVRPQPAGPRHPTFSFDADFQVESYLRHQGSTFVDRFDANSYLYLTRAMDYFDLAADYGGVLANAFQGHPTRFCVISFTSDWLFPTSNSRAIVHALECRRRARLVCRDQDRQGPRCLPARRAGTVPDRARLPRFGRGCARHRREGVTPC